MATETFTLVCIMLVAGLQGAYTQPAYTQSGSPTSTSYYSSPYTYTAPRPIDVPCPVVRCRRVLRPVCASVNGARRTMANRCVLNAKISCVKRRRRAGVLRLPRIRFLHKGACFRGTTTKKGQRTTRRRTTKRPIIVRPVGRRR